MRIFTTLALAESELDLQQRAPAESTVISARRLADESARVREFLQADVVFGNPPVAWLAEARRLRWIQLESVGSEAYQITPTPEWRRRIQFTNLNGFFGQPVAESLVAGVLAMNRGIRALCLAQQNRRWERETVRPQLRLTQHSRAIILGAGSIGQAVGRILGGFDVDCAYFARTSKLATIRSLAELDASLPEADYVFGCLPDSPDTRGLLSGDRLGRMKPGAIVANGGRGSLIDEAALIECLNLRGLGGAVLDVTQVEPLPPGHPFWTHPRILLTQHTGGGFPHEIRGKTDFFLHNLQRFQRGEPLINPVSPP